MLGIAMVRPITVRGFGPLLALALFLALPALPGSADDKAPAGFQIEAAFLVGQPPPLLEVIGQDIARHVVDRQEKAARAGTVFLLGNG